MVLGGSWWWLRDLPIDFWPSASSTHGTTAPSNGQIWLHLGAWAPQRPERAAQPGRQTTAGREPWGLAVSAHGAPCPWASSCDAELVSSGGIHSSARLDSVSWCSSASEAAIVAWELTSVRCVFPLAGLINQRDDSKSDMLDSFIRGPAVAKNG